MAETSAEITLSRIRVVSELTAAYVASHHIRPAQLPELIASLFLEVNRIAQAPAVEEAAPEVGRASAAQIRKSVTPDALISLIDGKPYRTLKRHLTKHGLTPAAYRTRYDLPSDYPMTAPSYSERRSAFAKGMGFGNHGSRRGRKARS